MLAITLIIPISGFATEIRIIPTINQSYSDPFDNYGGPPPIPGDMSFPFPIHEGPENIEKISRRHNTDTVGRNDIIIDMIQQLDESMILEYLEDLVAFGPRITETTECEQAGEWIYNEFESMGLDVRYHNWSNEGYDSENIEATLPGLDETSDEIYIICGHYDSVEGAPGADDDGSGTIATIAAAYIMSKYSFDHTIRFVAFSGEEQGLLGSEKYVQEAYSNGDNIVATLNVDMIGFAETENQGNNIKIYHNDDSDWLVDFTDDIADQYNEYINLNVIPSGWSWGSDHYYFWEYGYDALFYHEYEFNYYYHSPEDTIENMNLTYDVKCSRLILATLAELSIIFISDLDCEGSLAFGEVNTDSTCTREFTVENIGAPESELDWEIAEYPNWGDWTFTPESGDDLTPEDGSVTVSVEVVVPSDKNTDFTGTVKIVNKENSADYCEMEVTLTTPRSHSLAMFLERILEQFPNAFPILRYLLGL